MFYLMTHSTHFIYGYMASDIWLRTILIERKETRCRHIGYSYRLTARVLLYAPSHRQDNTYHGLCYTSRGALAGTRNSSMGVCTQRTPTARPFVFFTQYFVLNNNKLSLDLKSTGCGCCHVTPIPSGRGGWTDCRSRRSGQRAMNRN